MDRIYALSPLDVLHFLAGCGMILAIWGVLYVSKGSRAHKVAGRVFVCLFVFVALTSLPRVLRVYVEGDVARASSFAILALLALVAVAQGVLSIYFKNSSRLYYDGVWRILLAHVLVGVGLSAVVADVLTYHTYLLGVFGSLAILESARMFGQMHFADRNYALWWKAEHMHNMITIAVAAHIGLVFVVGFIANHNMSNAMLAVCSLPLIAIGIAVVMRMRKRHLLLV